MKINTKVKAGNRCGAGTGPGSNYDI